MTHPNPDRVADAVSQAAQAIALTVADDAEALIAGATLVALLLGATGMRLDDFTALTASAMAKLTQTPRKDCP
jgi:hypothetical protein